MVISRRTLLKNLAILGMAGSYGFLFSQNTMAGQMNFEAYKGKILIAYFSRIGENYGVGNITKGNTEIVAEFILQQVGGDLFHIEPAVQYPQNYDECVDLAKKEQSAKARPELASTLESIQNMMLFFWASLTGGEICPCQCILLWNNLILMEKSLFLSALMKEAAWAVFHKKLNAPAKEPTF